MVKGWVELFKNLPAVVAQYGYDFNQEEVNNMYYKDARRDILIDPRCPEAGLDPSQPYSKRG